MPIVNFVVRWPDRSETLCTSPSSIVRDYFQTGAEYTLPEFLERSRSAFASASERVRAKYGYACSMAAEQLADIEDLAAPFVADDADARVTIVRCD